MDKERKIKSGEEFYRTGLELEGKDALTISNALINFYFEGREYGYDEAKRNYKEVLNVRA